MKRREGFVSNSSSGSFIFPKGISVDEARSILADIEKFLTKLKGENVYSGLGEPRAYKAKDKKNRGSYWDVTEYFDDHKINPEDIVGRVIVDTVGDNTCPYTFHEILTSVVNADYIHYG